MIGWRYVSERFPCPVCGNDSGCAVKRDNSVAMCLRATAGLKKLESDMGWLVKIGEASGSKSLKSSKAIVEPRLSLTECAAMQKRLASAVNPEKLAELAKSLGVSVAALKLMEIGYCHDRQAWTFPMRDGKRRICGFRTRVADGGKRCIKGSRTGIFIPSNLHLDAECLADFDGSGPTAFPPVLLVPEGPTDAAAALDIGFRAIGRPNNQGGGDDLRDLLAAGDRIEVVIVSDHDPVKRMKDGTPRVPGWEGALFLASKIIDVCGTLKICRPPGKIKDIRDWMVKGGEAAVMRALIEDTEVITPKILKEKQERLDEWKLGLKRQAMRKADSGAA